MDERDHVRDQSDVNERHNNSSPNHVDIPPQPRDSHLSPKVKHTINELRDRTRLSRDNIRSREASRPHFPGNSPGSYEFPSRDRKHSSHDPLKRDYGKDAEIGHLKTELTKAHEIIETLRAQKSGTPVGHVTLEDHNSQLAASAKQLHEIYGQKVMSKVQKYRSRKQSQVKSLKDRISSLESALRDSRRENSELVAAVDEYIDVSKTCDDG
ncbi:hypothetical protein BD777DRAFT_146999 [Yarrowia lipolytica]|nr:hypothetical protein BKA90DRAFT_176100 [Yarrowia lipolytica]RMI98289.1 hypothetical protein BD777DRAFT_146999 [Yarrowia lipolytica]